MMALKFSIMKITSTRLAIAGLACTVLLQVVNAATINSQAEQLAIQPRAYKMVREDMIAQQAQMIQSADMVIFGDSIAEAMIFSGRCGVVFNASRSGIGVPVMQKLAQTTLRHVQAKRIVIAVGTNSVIVDGDDPVLFKTNYSALLDDLGQKPFALVGVENGARANAVIQQIAAERGIHFVAPVPKHMTHDGVHPGPVGARLWRDRVEALCAEGEGAKAAP